MDGEILHKILTIKGLGETQISKDLGVTRRNVYNYYKSENISRKIKEKFRVQYGIDISEEYLSELQESSEKHITQKGKLSNNHKSHVNEKGVKYAEKDSNSNIRASEQKDSQDVVESRRRELPREYSELLDNAELKFYYSLKEEEQREDFLFQKLKAILSESKIMMSHVETLKGRL